MPKLEAYTKDSRYLFKTGFDSYVSGTVDSIYEFEIHLKNVQLQIPPQKVEKFVSDGKEMKDSVVHSHIILPRVNIDWALPIK